MPGFEKGDYMKTISSIDINVLQTDDLTKSLYGKVIGTVGKDGMVIRGRLIKADDRELWLQKVSGDVVMLSRSGIDRIWISRDCQKETVV
jgi:hypothetical protein